MQNDSKNPSISRDDASKILRHAMNGRGNPKLDDALQVLGIDRTTFDRCRKEAKKATVKQTEVPVGFTFHNTYRWGWQQFAGT